MRAAIPVLGLVLGVPAAAQQTGRMVMIEHRLEARTRTETGVPFFARKEPPLTFAIDSVSEVAGIRRVFGELYRPTSMRKALQ